MAENKRSFVLYTDYIHTVKRLPLEKAGELFMTILQYVNDMNPEPDDILIQVTFEPIKQQLKRDLKKWEGTKTNKSDGGRLGNLKRWHPDLHDAVITENCTLQEAEAIAKHRKASHTDDMRSDSIASIAVTVTDNVTVIDTVTDNTSTIVDEPANNEKELKQSYSFLSKNFLSVCEFVEKHRPSFPEPYVDLWNLFAKEVNKSTIRELTDARRKKLLCRIREPDFDFVTILNKARDSNLLRLNGWFGFDWITKNQENYLKVLECNYDNDRIQNLIHGNKYSGSTTSNSKQQQYDAIDNLINQTSEYLNKTGT